MAEFQFAIFSADNFLNPDNPGHLPIEDGTHLSELSSGDTLTWLSGGTSASVTVVDNANSIFDEAHSNQTLAANVNFNGSSYGAGQVVTPSYILVLSGSDGNSYRLMSFNFSPNSGLQEPDAAAWLGDIPPPGTVLTVTGEQNPTGASGPDFNLIAPCFTRGARIATRDGAKRVETLRPGVKVQTETGHYSEILWIGSKQFDLHALTANPRLWPVRICAGALGNGLPERDLLVSRQHRMLVSSRIALRMFGQADVLIPAIRLTALPGIAIDTNVTEVEYFHILLANHEVVFAEDAATESLYTGKGTLAALSPEAREEIMAIFPELTAPDYVPVAARYTPDGAKQKRLIQRHLKNRQPVQGMTERV
ncbi:Hint domain-containing protein [Halocynthiibacter styelae]|uniref:Hint domain-containing protein n=1 Tax=Halocynthiibacter styelae TaxID=2761955 RepID=A0A8J7IWP6_9RHOB|nr:Hint domain-containing protein [Paenihalocynthiibacter styelae]MBI1493255.1 Hint domain-containing protein [Paenihalocynthiibacter styelae]